MPVYERNDFNKSSFSDSESLKRELSGVETGEAPKETPPKEDIVVDKFLQAERFILYSYLFNKEYTADVDIASIEFLSDVGVALQNFIINEKKKGEPIKPNIAFDNVSEEYAGDINEILKIEITEQVGLDKERFFRDCVKSLTVTAIDKKITSLSALYKSETEVEKRKQIAIEINKLNLKRRGL